VEKIMHISKAFAFLAFLLTISFSNAQTETEPDKFDLENLQDQGVIITIDSGFIPTNLESMVNFSDLIVKGRFGKLLSHGPFYGYGSSRESAIEKYGITDESELKYYSVPVSEYEIIVDDVFHGTLPDGQIVYRAYEDNPSDDRFTSHSTQRIFFLGLQPDNQAYGVLGSRWILELIEEKYFFLDFEEDENGRYAPLPFAQNNDVEAFEASVKVAVERVAK
jgi:hypothetical protein